MKSRGLLALALAGAIGLVFSLKSQFVDIEINRMDLDYTAIMFPDIEGHFKDRESIFMTQDEIVTLMNSIAEKARYGSLSPSDEEKIFNEVNAIYTKTKSELQAVGGYTGLLDEEFEQLKFVLNRW